MYESNQALSVYQSFKYAKIICNNFFPYRMILGVSPMFICFYSNGFPRMVLPLYKKSFKNIYYMFGYKTGCAYLNPIYFSDITISEIADYMRTLKQILGSGKLLITYIQETSIFFQYITTQFRHYMLTDCVAINFEDGYDTYLNSLSKNVRQNIRTAYNRLKRNNLSIKLDVRSEASLTKLEFKHVYDIYIGRMGKRYNKKTTFIHKAFIKNFDIGSRAINELNSDVSWYLLYINDELAGFYNAFLSRDRLEIIVPRLAIAEGYEWYSPGLLLLNESIRYLIENSAVKSIDLIHGLEKYKLDMGGQKKMCCKIVLDLEGI